MKTFLFLAGISVTGLFSSSCSTAESRTAGGETAILVSDSAAVRRLFEQRCGICHGGDGHTPIQGSKDLGASILNRDEIMNQIMNGKGTMPPFRHLPADQIEALTEYTLSLQKP